ncbi:transposase [Streptomyces sp. NPDC006132]|uniref:transposase n=1 Tax=Streptomyces sp. NPDC006132 TaxID=3156732 RepID=UPI003400CA0A
MRGNHAKGVRIDYLSFPKCGTASVGVTRQYCGAAGKRADAGSRPGCPCPSTSGLAAPSAPAMGGRATAVGKY